jgi:methionyl-tRNA formyltransferase
MGARLIEPTLKGLADGSLRGRVQDETQVTYAKKLEKAMETLDPLARTAAELDRQVRGLSPWPGSSLFLQVGAETRRLKIREASPRTGIRLPAGSLDEKAGMLVLGTSEGVLELKKMQWEGKKETDAAGFLNGLRGSAIALPLQTKKK